MKITKVFNNNAVMAVDKQNEDIILLGNGLGFHKKPGDSVLEERIQRKFKANKNEKLIELIELIPPIYLELTEEIIRFAREEYNLECNESIYLHLTDHIYYAVERLKDGIDLDNPFLLDVKQFYTDEYYVGLHAKKIIKKLLGVDISLNEVGYISLHIVEGSTNQNRRDLPRIFELITFTIDFFEKKYLKDVDKDGLSYNRFVRHVKYFAGRYVKRNENDEKDEVLEQTIDMVFKEEVLFVNELSENLEKKFGNRISKSEANYLVLHLRNCKNIS